MRRRFGSERMSGDPCRDSPSRQYEAAIERLTARTLECSQAQATPTASQVAVRSQPRGHDGAPGDSSAIGSLVDLPRGVSASTRSPLRPRTTPPGGRLSDHVERGSDDDEVPVVHPPVIELPSQLLKQFHPLSPARLTFAPAALDDSLADDLHGDESRLGSPLLLPGPAPAWCRAPLRKPTSRLGPERLLAPPARQRGRAAHRHVRALGMGRRRFSRSSGRTLMLRGPTR